MANCVLFANKSNQSPLCFCCYQVSHPARTVHPSFQMTYRSIWFHCEPVLLIIINSLLKETISALLVYTSPFSEWLSHLMWLMACYFLLSSQLVIFLISLTRHFGPSLRSSLPFCSGFISALLHWRFSSHISNLDLSPWPLTWISNSLLGISLPPRVPDI